MLTRLPVLAAVVTACLLVVAVTPASAVEPNEQVIRATYPVADLVTPTAEFAKTTRTGKPQPTLEDRLIRQIVQTIQPATWNDNGGTGTIQYFGPTMSLVVNQTPKVQRQVAALLAELRKAQDIEVALEVRIVSIPEDFRGQTGVERIRGDGETPSPTDECRPRPTKETTPQHVVQIMNDLQLSVFLDGVASDKKTTVTMAPKLTLANRQTSNLEISDAGHASAAAGEPAATPDGFRLTARPQVSADRRFVKLALKVEQKDATPAVCQTVVMPDGGTVLLGGLRTVVEVRKESGVPMVNGIPYINRFYRKSVVVQEPRRVFVLVTPRIVVPEETEEAAPPKVQDAPRSEPVAEEPLSRQAKVLAELLRAYDAACAEGRGEEAEKLARAALILEPTCFRRK